MPRVIDREVRRAELVSAAEKVFARRGVASTTVSDIVREAGVAQGTFYLYFQSKDEAVLAVGEQMADAIIDGATARVTCGASAVDRLVILGDVLSDLAAEPAAAVLLDLIHRPENRALHDRLDDAIGPRLIPLVEEIIEQGIAEGAFSGSDSRAVAWFVLAGLQSVEIAGTTTSEMPTALAKATEFALRALGYQGQNP